MYFGMSKFQLEGLFGRVCVIIMLQSSFPRYHLIADITVAFADYWHGKKVSKKQSTSYGPKPVGSLT